MRGNCFTSFLYPEPYSAGSLDGNGRFGAGRSKISTTGYAAHTTQTFPTPMPKAVGNVLQIGMIADNQRHLYVPFT